MAKREETFTVRFTRAELEQLAELLRGRGYIALKLPPAERLQAALDDGPDESTGRRRGA